MVRRLIVILLLVLSAIVLAVIVLVRPPSWWDPVPLGDPVASDLGERFERGCVSELHRARDDRTPWAVRIRESEVNAWLGTRLPLWCAHAGIAVPGPAQVRFEEGVIEFAVDAAGLPGVVVARSTPEVESDGIITNLSGAALGRLPLSFLAEPALVVLGSTLEDADDDLLGSLAGLLVHGRAPREFSLADGRRVRLRQIEVRSGELVLEFETLGRDD